ncbi:MAG: hypothetical protein IMZ75_03250 [Actinobacteria bacterium]|nr:hypothetical protein [Actinomycetota bacterium]
MRLNRLVVGSVLIAALALVALPDLAGSRVPSPVEPVPVSAFQPLSVQAVSSRSVTSVEALDSAFVSDGAMTIADIFLEPGEAPRHSPTQRHGVSQPEPAAGSVNKPPKVKPKPPRYTMTGAATFYDHGTTAMRLPLGTIVVICGRGGCIQRTVTDYGPTRKDRIVDLYRPDFFAICGCASWSGTTTVTVSVY